MRSCRIGYLRWRHCWWRLLRQLFWFLLVQYRKWSDKKHLRWIAEKYHTKKHIKPWNIPVVKTFPHIVFIAVTPHWIAYHKSFHTVLLNSRGATLTQHHNSFIKKASLNCAHDIDVSNHIMFEKEAGQFTHQCIYILHWNLIKIHCNQWIIKRTYIIFFMI